MPVTIAQVISRSLFGHDPAHWLESGSDIRRSMISAGSSLVPLPDIKRARQGEAMPVIAATGRSEVGGRSNGSMQEGVSSDDESDDAEVEKIKLDINMSRLKLAKALKRSSRSSAGSRSSTRGGRGKGSGPSASLAEPGGEPDVTNSLEEDLEKILEDHFANVQSEPPTVVEAGVGREPSDPVVMTGSIPACGEVPLRGQAPNHNARKGRRMSFR